MAPAAQPTPTPTLAPVLSPEDGEGSLEVDVAADAAEPDGLCADYRWLDTVSEKINKSVGPKFCVQYNNDKSCRYGQLPAVGGVQVNQQNGYCVKHAIQESAAYT